MSRVNLGAGSSKNFRGGGMVKKTGVKKYVAGGIVAGAAKELGKKSLKAGKKLFEKSTKRKGRPPKSKMAKAKSRVNLGAADPASAGGYVAGGYALGDSGEKPVKKASGGEVSFTGRRNSGSSGPGLGDVAVLGAIYGAYKYGKRGAGKKKGKKKPVETKEMQKILDKELKKPVKKAAGGAVKNIQDPQKFAPIDRLGMTAEQRRQQREMVKSFREYFAKDKKKKK